MTVGEVPVAVAPGGWTPGGGLTAGMGSGVCPLEMSSKPTSQPGGTFTVGPAVAARPSVTSAARSRS